jgi:hypothetical protein
MSTAAIHWAERIMECIMRMERIMACSHCVTEYPHDRGRFSSIAHQPNRLRNSHSPWLDYGGMPRAIGNWPTNLLSRMKAPRVRGCTPTSIAKKAIRTTRHTGTVGRESPFAENPSTQNG